MPGGDVIKAFVKLGFNANWLLTGEGEMKREAVYPLAETLKNGDITSDGSRAAVMVAPSPGPPKINGITPVEIKENPFAWFHEWIDEELQGKCISDVMGVAVKIKAELDKEREG